MTEHELIRKIIKFLGNVDQNDVVSLGFDTWGEETISNIEDTINDILKLIDDNGFKITPKE